MNIKLIIGVLACLALIVLAVSMHGQPHTCTEGIYTWTDVGRILLGVSCIVAAGVIIGLGLIEYRDENS